MCCLIIKNKTYIWRGVFGTTLFDNVCQRLATGRWFYLDTPIDLTTTI